MARTGEWGVRLYLFEEDGTTKARMVLDTGTTSLTGHGTAQCSPEDPDVPEIGDELAASRAMSDLAAQLKRIAYGDLEGVRAPAAPARTRRTEPAG
ncbi:hypothetical protein HEK616_28560 [Streptomyces nigrescens]|uniref:DUF1876 domain-containing protein n=2 Tax=Streptomyces TaxID=1883 RepID=A0ABN6QT61_STRNI|nr:DUF1876 domain-containing protein [Streptomyces nigrescens]MEE4418285.1 DUF1876 domain-containing protein [Streptomyces sp. DSM 41528]BDM69369.1 hypothetical protein HEK616_28560 [Streptomyces nigrescens]